MTAPMSEEQEAEIMVRLAQKYAVGHLPAGVTLSEATREQLSAAIKEGMAAKRAEQERRPRLRLCR